MQEKISGVFQERFLFVKRHRKPSARQQFLPSTQGLPQVRTLRDSMDHMSALFDRRCRTQTARDELKKLRQSDWQVDFTQYSEGGGQLLPRRLSAVNDDVKVILVIDNWVFR